MGSEIDDLEYMAAFFDLEVDCMVERSAIV